MPTFSNTAPLVPNQIIANSSRRNPSLLWRKASLLSLPANLNQTLDQVNAGLWNPGETFGQFLIAENPFAEHVVAIEIPEVDETGAPIVCTFVWVSGLPCNFQGTRFVTGTDPAITEITVFGGQ